jgi:hypothetical protein
MTAFYVKIQVGLRMMCMEMRWRLAAPFAFTSQRVNQMSQRSFAMTCALLGLASGRVLAAMNRFGYVFEPREPHEIYQIPKPDSTFRFETICINKKTAAL